MNRLDLAKEISPTNPQARLQRARVLFHDEQWEEALEELEVVAEFCPKDSSVHLFMGKVCNKLNLRDRAMVHFIAALDLNPKDASHVREAMNQMDESFVEAPMQRDFDVDDDDEAY